MTPIDRNYYRARAAEHRAKSDAAELPNVAQIHAELAEKYETLAEAVDVAPSAQVGWGTMPAQV